MPSDVIPPPYLTIDDWIVAWTPHDAVFPGSTWEPGAIEVGKLGNDKVYGSERYAFTGGMCYVDRRSMSLEKKIQLLFVDFNTIVVRDGIDPQRAHREFCKIYEYRIHIPMDMPGALPWPDEER